MNGKHLKAEHNRTIELTGEERKEYKKELLKINHLITTDKIMDKVINQDIFEVLDYLPSKFIDLLFIDPPYNLSKTFNDSSFKQVSINQYAKWVSSWIKGILRLLKPTTSIYICGDWHSSAAVQLVCEKYFIIRNRITFEREKGRGAKENWKNNSEDIWFCTVSNKYYFNPDMVKLKRRVMAPYHKDGEPKDWVEEEDGKYRLTYPSNVWTDITIPFWSMRENTPHPTQKPEKLLAKVILASSREGDVIFDPFAGVGTSGVVAKKLKRNFVMVEIDEEYCLYAQKRLDMAEKSPSIQGYSDNIFWERNTFANQDLKTKQEKSKIEKKDS